MITLFKLNRDVLKSQLRNSSSQRGVCAASSIDFCYNELSGYHQGLVPFEYTNYYSEGSRFIQRQQIYINSFRHREIHRWQVIRPEDGLTHRISRVTSNWDKLLDLKPGVYMVNMDLLKGTGHAIVIMKREFWVCFNPAFGAWVFEKGIKELVRFLKTVFPVKKICVIAVTKDELRPAKPNPISTFRCGPLSLN